MFFSIFKFFYNRYTSSYSKVAFLLKGNIRPKIRCLGPCHWLNPGVITHSGRCGISSLCVSLSPFDEQLSGKRLKLYPKPGTDSESELAVLCTCTHQQDHSWGRHTWHTAALPSHAGSVWFCNRPGSVPTAFLEHHCLPRGSTSSSAWFWVD